MGVVADFFPLPFLFFLLFVLALRKPQPVQKVLTELQGNLGASGTGNNCGRQLGRRIAETLVLNSWVCCVCTIVMGYDSNFRWW